MGGPSTPTTTTVNQNTSSLPAYAQPYFESLMQGANANLKTPYIPYGYTQNKTTGVDRKSVV